MNLTIIDGYTKHEKYAITMKISYFVNKLVNFMDLNLNGVYVIVIGYESSLNRAIKKAIQNLTNKEFFKVFFMKNMRKIC